MRTVVPWLPTAVRADPLELETAGTSVYNLTR